MVLQIRGTWILATRVAPLSRLNESIRYKIICRLREPSGGLRHAEGSLLRTEGGPLGLSNPVIQSL